MGMTQSRIFMFVSTQCHVSCRLATCLASLPDFCIFFLLELHRLIPATLTFSNSVVYKFSNTMPVRLELEKSDTTMEKC
jgi:hypothetical protein